MTCRIRSKARYKLCDRSPSSHSFALLLLSPPDIDIFNIQNGFMSGTGISTSNQGKSLQRFDSKNRQQHLPDSLCDMASVFKAGQAISSS